MPMPRIWVVCRASAWGSETIVKRIKLETSSITLILTMLDFYRIVIAISNLWKDRAKASAMWVKNKVCYLIRAKKGLKNSSCS